MKMLISGNWVDSSNKETIEVTNPYDGKLLETVPNAAKEDVDTAIADAVKAQKVWNKVIIRERAKILRRYLTLLEKNREDLARTLTLETGKPIFDSYGEIDSVYMTFESSVEIVKHHYGKTMPMGIEGGYDDDLQVTVHEPLGVIACIVPFNFPAALWAFKAGPALMAGNAIVVKPATSNPLSVMKLMGLLVEAGVTPGAVQCITGRGATVGNWMSGHPDIAQVNLTGGVEAGKEIARHAAENLTAYKFELGGNDPLIICADCDMDLAVNEAGDKTRNAGQCCSGAKRFIVHESIKDEFVSRLIEERLKTVKEGDLLDINTDFGVLISEKAAKEVESQVQHTMDQGAKLVYGGVRRGAYYMPTVLDKFELGGNDPLIICADCDMDLAVNEAGDKTRNAGQCCSGAKRFIVHESIKDEFVSRLIEERLKTVKEGDLLDINTDFGVLISEKAAKEVESQVQHTMDQGAKLVYGGVRRGAYYMPTVLDNCTKDMDICNDMEIFGPVFPVFTFKTLDEAIEIAETSEYGLSAGVITENLKDAMKVAASLQTGMVAVNGSGGFRAQELPFGGGKKMSGNSRECMSSVLEEVTQEKSIIFRYAMKKYNET